MRPHCSTTSPRFRRTGGGVTISATFFEISSCRIAWPSAARLRIGIGDEVMRTDYISYADDESMMLVPSYEPLAITRGTPIEKPEEGPHMAAGIVDRFTAINLRPTVIVERLHARMPRPAEAEELKLRPGIPVVDRPDLLLRRNAD